MGKGPQPLSQALTLEGADVPPAPSNSPTMGRATVPSPLTKPYRTLEGIGASTIVAYLRMDDDAVARLEKALERPDPASLVAPGLENFTRAIGELYAELDLSPGCREAHRQRQFYAFASKQKAKRNQGVRSLELFDLKLDLIDERQSGHVAF